MKNKRPQHPIVFFPTREETNERQLRSILAVVQELQPYIIEPTHSPGETPRSLDMNGEAAIAAQTTFIKACGAIDAILEDKARFTLGSNDKLMDELVTTQKAQQKFIDAQRLSTQQMQKPSFLLKPTLATFGKTFVAYWGQIDQPGKAIVGRGKTPNEAIADFDLAFDRTPEDQVIIVAMAEGEKNGENKNNEN